MTKEELLAVLDMSEKEQVEYLTEQGIICLGRMAEYEGGGAFLLPESLADLAFRLRDEAKSKVEFHHCIAKVCKHIDPYIVNYAGYGLCTAKPIHWIIAALIAKDKDNDQ